jgi:hypothetical protein
MERIEIPVEVYWKSKQGKKFTSQEDCEKYERLFDKWQATNLYREIENVEGQLCYCYWVETKEELDEIIWLIYHKFYTSTCNYVKDFYPQWIIACPDYTEYTSEMAIRTLKDFREELDETLKAIQDTLSNVIKLTWEKI